MDNFESQDFDAMVWLTPLFSSCLCVPHCLPNLHSGNRLHWGAKNLIVIHQ